MVASSIALFEQKSIRKIRHNNEWFFSIIDVVFALTDSTNARDYWYKMKIRIKDESNFEPSTICRQLKLLAPDGKMRETDCSNTEGIFRIIQSIPSPKAEPFKLWLAKVWYERIQEIQDPELAQDRMKTLYEAKWYNKDWIDKRLRGMAIRQNLTDERKERWITKHSDYAILTAEISNATFGMTPSEYREHKWLSQKQDNLRDHMTDLELIFTMLGEKVTTEISHNEQPNTFQASKKVAQRWGRIAGNARKETEEELGGSIISKQNFLSRKKRYSKKNLE